MLTRLACIVSDLQLENSLPGKKSSSTLEQNFLPKLSLIKTWQMVILY